MNYQKEGQKECTKEWIEDISMPYFRPRYKIKKVLYEGSSQYQGIKVVESFQFGKMLLLDDIIQLSQLDEFMYHEMLVHVPMLSCEAVPKSVFIAGGGDGCCVREVLKYKSIKEIIWAEIDKEVVSVAKKYLKDIVGEDIFYSDKVDLRFQEASALLNNYENFYDVIIVDSTDPVKEAIKLYTEEFYQIAKKALKEHGILVCQSGSVIFQPSFIRKVVKNMKTVFKIVEVYTTIVPTYPGCWWSFAISSNHTKASDVSHIEERIKNFNLSFNYYNPSLHKACFIHPTLLKSIIQEEEFTFGLFKNKDLIWDVSF